MTIIKTRLFPSVARTDETPLRIQTASKNPYTVGDILKLASSTDKVDSKQSCGASVLFIFWSLVISLERIHCMLIRRSVASKWNLTEMKYIVKMLYAFSDVSKRVIGSS